MSLNMGNTDRLLRLVAAAIIAYLYFNHQIAGITGSVLIAFAGILAVTSFIGFCPLYLPFGISTRKKLIMDKKSTIVDVRTREEYQGGHVANSVNIPLQELPNRLAEMKKLPQPIVLCCASGVRSARATSILRNAGVECQNGGSWLDVNAALNA